MGYLEWSKDYEIGIPEMDRQHRELFRLLDRFYASLEASESPDNLVILAEDLQHYMELHFSDEERLMHSIGYRQVTEQKLMHQEIALKLGVLKNRLNEGRSPTAFYLDDEQRSWLRSHIMHEDQKYALIYFCKT